MLRPALPLVALILAASPASAQVHRFAALALSPAGDRIADVESGDADHGAIMVRGLDGAILRKIDPCAACSYSGLTFGPDGTLAFLARDRAAGVVRLSVADARGARTIATIGGIAQTPRFSPDGRRIALLVTLAANKEAGASQAGVRQVGEIGEANDEQRLAVFDIGGTVAAKDVAPVSPAGRYVYEYDWTPDGAGFVATTALGNGDANWWVATLDAIDARTGTVRSIARPSTQANYPRVSPDGKTVAYIGGLMSDFGSVGGDIWTVPIGGGTPTDRTPDYKASVTSLDWTRGGIRATTLAGAEQQVIAFDPAKGPAVLWSRPASLAAGDGRAAYSADGRIAASVVQDFEHAPAIQAGPVGAMRAVTHDNDAVAPIVASRSITWRNEGHDVQGWLLTPRTPVSGMRAMVVDVHGGPAAAHVPGFVTPGGLGDLIGAGYAVFLPNPRGSYGQGEAFTAANRRDFGGGDLRDILSGIDAVEKVAPIDDARLGLMGGSYGGFMAMWANTQTNRFKAILAAAGLSDWTSYYGTNGIDQWMIPYFGQSLYADPDIYRKLSPITYVTRAKTPTFISVGERDIEVPPTQSVEWWSGLKAMGVPTSLVIYPDEGHGIRGAANAADVRRRSLAWLARYLGPARP
ncbi:MULTISPECIES: S9 family peptidase [unclassified Sphingomonas]|uniref:alpha/beta hydrolase family protein n=1 Tax=unclassified Sphingomonas TaxID=196159 RepID=UPI00226A89D6|nr:MULTISPECIES: S9 family peptidase [unclassified Sphingomonas]